MLSSVLHSKGAIQVNIQIMDTFVRIRQLLGTHKDLARKLEELEEEYDAKFRVVFDAIRKLMDPEQPPLRRQIGRRACRMFHHPHASIDDTNATPSPNTTSVPSDLLQTSATTDHRALVRAEH